MSHESCCLPSMKTRTVYKVVTGRPLGRTFRSCLFHHTRLGLTYELGQPTDPVPGTRIIGFSSPLRAFAFLNVFGTGNISEMVVLRGEAENVKPLEILMGIEHWRTQGIGEFIEWWDALLKKGRFDLLSDPLATVRAPKGTVTATRFTPERTLGPELLVHRPCGKGLIIHPMKLGQSSNWLTCTNCGMEMLVDDERTDADIVDILDIIQTKRG